MGRKNQSRRQRVTHMATRDSYANFAADTGIQADNLTRGGRYEYGAISRDRNNLDQAYRSSWLVRVGIDAIAEDMTRSGVDVVCELHPEEIDRMHEAAAELQVWEALCGTLKWARLYGGAIAIMMIDGQDFSTPLRIDTVQKGQFRGLLVLDRWMLTPSEQKVQEYGTNFGKPEYYRADGDGASSLQGAVHIHYSRVIRLEGDDLPHFQRMSENGWGQSCLESVYDRLLAFDSTTQGIAQLVFKAHLRTYKVAGLRDLIASGGTMYDALIKQVDMIRLWQRNEGLTLMDEKDEFEAHSFAFSGLPELLQQFGQQISGAWQIPMVRLFGQSPAGFSTGDTDLRQYYDTILKRQNRDLRGAVHRIYDLISINETGHRLPEGTRIRFRPLWQLSETERAAVAQTITATVMSAEASGVIGKAGVLKELRQQSEMTGVWSNISDDEIDAAEAEENVPLIGQTGNAPSGAGRTPEDIINELAAGHLNPAG